MLSVSADNSSLNQILRQISSSTGMKITGGVTDERVFGQYGPDTPAQVLAALLDGTSSNMVIEQRDPDAPAELILTPRKGGPTPPNPNAAAFDDRPERRQAPPPEPEQPASVPVQSSPALPQPTRPHPPEHLPPTPPSPTLPTESKRRSRSTSSCSACASNSSPSPSPNKNILN